MLSSVLLPLVAGLALAAEPVPGVAVQGPGSEPTIAALTIDIWPEYDDPRVLAIYDGMMAPDTRLPTEFTFVVPGDAQVHMAGGIAAEGGHIHADFDTRVRADGMMEVSYTLEVPHVYMEFYYDPLDGGNLRRFTFPVISPFAIDSLAVRVQQPARAHDFVLEPAGVDSMRDRRGLEYEIVRWAGLPAETTTRVTVSYRKTDRQPSVTAQAAQASARTGASADEPPAGPSRGRIWTWTLATLALGFFGVGFYKVFTTGPLVPRAGDRRQRKGAGGVSASQGRFCTECGQPSAPTHRFCGRCGIPLD